DNGAARRGQAWPSPAPCSPAPGTALIVPAQPPGTAMHIATSPAFKQNAHDALANKGLQKALARSGPSFIARRTAAVGNLPEFEQLRDEARDIRNHTLANLDFYLEAYEAKV